MNELVLVGEQRLRAVLQADVVLEPGRERVPVGTSPAAVSGLAGQGQQACAGVASDLVEIEEQFQVGLGDLDLAGLDPADLRL